MIISKLHIVSILLNYCVALGHTAYCNYIQCPALFLSYYNRILVQTKTDACNNWQVVLCYLSSCRVFMTLRHLHNITDLLIAQTATPAYCLDSCKSTLRRLDVTGCECVSTISMCRDVLLDSCLNPALDSVSVNIQDGILYIYTYIYIYIVNIQDVNVERSLKQDREACDNSYLQTLLGNLFLENHYHSFDTLIAKILSKEWFD